MHVFFFFFFLDKFTIKNNLQNKMQVVYFSMASKNIDSDHVFHVIDRVQVIFLFLHMIVTYE